MFCYKTYVNISFYTYRDSLVLTESLKQLLPTPAKISTYPLIWSAEAAS